jgi:hypothetical protein
MALLTNGVSEKAPAAPKAFRKNDLLVFILSTRLFDQVEPEFRINKVESTSHFAEGIVNG